MLLGWCTRIGWALAQRSNGPDCSVAHFSCFANSPTLCRKCHSRVCACGVKNAGYHSPSSCRCKKIARRPCLVYEGALAPFHSRGMSNETLPALFRTFPNSVWPSLISEEVHLFGRLPAERRATKAYAERLRIVMGRNAIEYGFDSQEFGGCLESFFNQNL